MREGQSRHHSRRRCRGQSIVEFVLVLPILALFLYGLIETGFAMYSYIRVAAANREAARLASRGRFTNETVVAQVVAAGGSRQVAGVTEPNLRTSGLDANTGVVVSHVNILLAEDRPPLPGEDCPPLTIDVEVPTPHVSGTLTLHQSGNPVTRPIEPGDSKLSRLGTSELADYLDYRVDVGRDIYCYRRGNDFQVMSAESFVIVETYYAHDLFSGFLPFLEDPMILYFSSELRVLQDSRLD